MIHRGNLGELENMRNWLQKLGIREWNLDIPCIGGRLSQNQDLWVDPEEGAPFLDFGFGGSDHGGTGDFACGRHLAAVLPDGRVAKCGLIRRQTPGGAWRKGWKIVGCGYNTCRLSDLECAAREHMSDCRGGCRFRAGSGLGPDPIMCARYGIDPNIFRR